MDPDDEPFRANVAELMREFIERLTELATSTDDDALVRESMSIWDEQERVLQPLRAVSGDDLAAPADWVHRPTDERQRLTQAQLAYNIGSGFAAQSWRQIERAVELIDGIHRVFTAEAAAEFEQVALRKQLREDSTELTDLEGDIADLEQRRAEMAGKPLGEVASDTLRRLDQEISDKRKALRVYTDVRGVLDRLNAAIRDATEYLLQKLAEDVENMRDRRRQAIKRHRMEQIGHWVLVLAVAIALFGLGKVSDLFMWWLAALGAAALWGFDEFVAQPHVANYVARRAHRALIDEIATATDVRLSMRSQQARLNERLKKAGMPTVDLAPPLDRES